MDRSHGRAGLSSALSDKSSQLYRRWWPWTCAERDIHFYFMTSCLFCCDSSSSFLVCDSAGRCPSRKAAKSHHHQQHRHVSSYHQKRNSFYLFGRLPDIWYDQRQWRPADGRKNNSRMSPQKRISGNRRSESTTPSSKSAPTCRKV